MPESILSADSHVTEPPDTYRDRIEPRYRDTAPHMVRDEKLGDLFVVHGMKSPIPMGLVAAAGKDPRDITVHGVRFEELHRGGWDPEARLAEQDRDGVAGEIIYPTVGMVLCNHRDFDYKKACMDAYNRWIAEYCSAHPDRLFGVGQTAVVDVESAIEDLRSIKALGLRGVMMPGVPQHQDYQDPMYDPLWQAAIDLELPLSFHILTTRTAQVRGPAINGFLGIIRDCQDIIGTLVFGGVFERNPKLKVVCVEADAGWVPHYMYRMDHAFKRHRYWLKPGAELSRLPSEYFAENVYVTFQDDWVAFRTAELCNPRRLMWASDFPHSDSTWPWSKQVIEEQTKDLTPEQRDWILHDNVAELYGLAA
jgi:predicted TIM-barrel fold metal-dependent hydrolase